MYVDWVITLSVIILLLTCAFLGYGVVYALKKVHEADKRDRTRLAQTKTS